MNGNAMMADNEFIQVSEKTVGQYTGLKDKNGVKIFEGDVLLWEGRKYMVCFSEAMFYMSDDDSGHGTAFDIFAGFSELKHVKEVEVIGNIYDNQELLEESKDE